MQPQVGAKYYDGLVPREQTAYRLLLNAARNYRPTASSNLKPEDRTSIRRAMLALFLDCPELYYINFEQCRSGKNASQGFYIRMDFLHDSFERKLVDRALTQFCAELQKKLSPGMSARKKYRILAMEIGSRIRYQKTKKVDLDYTVAGPVTCSTGLCQAVSLLFLLACQQAGLPCMMVFGTISRGREHSWNRVWLDGESFYIDVSMMQTRNFRLLPNVLFFKLFPEEVFMSEKEIRSYGYKMDPFCESGGVYGGECK